MLQSIFRSSWHHPFLSRLQRGWGWSASQPKMPKQRLTCFLSFVLYLINHHWRIMQWLIAGKMSKEKARNVRVRYVTRKFLNDKIQNSENYCMIYQGMVKCIHEKHYINTVQIHIKSKTIYDIIWWNIIIDIVFFSFHSEFHNTTTRPVWPWSLPFRVQTKEKKNTNNLRPFWCVSVRSCKA